MGGGQLCERYKKANDATTRAGNSTQAHAHTRARFTTHSFPSVDARAMQVPAAHVNRCIALGNTDGSRKATTNDALSAARMTLMDGEAGVEASNAR
jgi:hypothetical protein